MMKSNIDQLKRRGFTEQCDLVAISHCSRAELILLIDSLSASERTAAVKLLSQIYTKEDKTFIDLLLQRLSKEKCLYTRLEIGYVLEKGGIETAKAMAGYLGRIGNNQYRTVPGASSKKKSYPLPRDIIARSLGRMSPSVIDVLFTVLAGSNRQKIAEAIDAIGYMVFYHPSLGTYDNFEKIRVIMSNYQNDALIIWKSIICLSAFPIKECAEFLECIILKTEIDVLKSEAFRSLCIIQNKSPDLKRPEPKNYSAFD